MPALSRSKAKSSASLRRGLQHVMVVAGTLVDWRDLGDAHWRRRVQVLGAAAAAEGASWLTVRPYAIGNAALTAERHEHLVDADGRRCTVIVEPTADGRKGFAAAMADLDAAAPVTEASVAAALYAPAEVEPDLVIVLGPGDRLPPSLVWELAYAELVFVDASWSSLDGNHIRQAAAEFSSRHRRFGGIET